MNLQNIIWKVDGARDGNGNLLRTTRQMWERFQNEYTTLNGHDWELLRTDLVYCGKQRGTDYRCKDRNLDKVFHVLFFPANRGNDRKIEYFEETPC